MRRPGQPFKGLAHDLLDDRVPHDQRLLRLELLEDLPQTTDSAPALNVPARRGEHRRKRPAYVYLHDPPGFPGLPQRPVGLRMLRRLLAGHNPLELRERTEAGGWRPPYLIRRFK